MATAPTLPLVSIEEYLNTSYEIECEYVNGVLIQKHMGSRTHGLFQGILYASLVSVQKERGIRVYLDQHIQMAPGVFRVPDVVIMPASHKREEILTEPPLATFEIVSQGEPWTSLRGKLADHLAMGVSTVIIADQYNKTVMVATPTEPLHEMKAPLILNISVPDGGVLQIDFDDLYRQLGE